MNIPSVKESRLSYLADAAEELINSALESLFDAAMFFEKFELLVRIPDAIQRFRELIIENCILGGFTATVDTESVANEYLLEPVFPGCKQNWRTLNFGRHCDIQGGNQPPKSQFIDEPKDGYIRLLQIRDLGDKPVPTYIPVESTNRFCTDGEILIGRYGASVGKIFWAQPGAYNVALAKFIYPNNAFISNYAFWLLKSAVFQRRVLASSRSAQAGFNKGDLASVDFPLPPLAEQKRIVAKVDELMGLCDRLETLEMERKERHAVLSRAALARFADAPTPSNRQFLFHKSFDVGPAELRKSILSMAVRGSISKQEPGDEPADQLVNRIAKAKASLVSDGEVGKSKPFPLDESSLPFTLPRGWTWCTLDSLCEAITKGSSPKWQGVSYVDQEGGLLFITSENVGNYRLRKLDDLKYVEPKFNEMETRSILNRGDILSRCVHWAHRGL